MISRLSCGAACGEDAARKDAAMSQQKGRVYHRAIIGQTAPFVGWFSLDHGGEEFP